MTDLGELAERIAAGKAGSVFLVTGDTVLSEPLALRLAKLIAGEGGVEPQVIRRPASLGRILEDLRTFSLFEAGKIRVVVECALLADRRAAAALIDEAAEVLPVAAGDDLSEAERAAGARLLQALRICGLGVGVAEPKSLLEELPDWALAGADESGPKGRRVARGRTKKQIAELRTQLLPLLEAALAAGLLGVADGDVADLGATIDGGLPAGHVLVLAESLVDAGHPLVVRLRQSEQSIEAGSLERDRRGEVAGLARLAAEMKTQTGVEIRPAALRELAQRTLRRTANNEQIDSESSSRLASEYRKLAEIAGSSSIDLALVRQVVEDRGDEDVWALLDDAGAGRSGQALTRLRRLLDGADDMVGARLSLFSLLAEFCRQLVWMKGLIEVFGVRPGESNYNRFKDRVAPALQQALADGSVHPLQRFHPFRLHRVYIAASRFSGDLSRLPAKLLDVEMRLKGESGDGETALTELLLFVSSATQTTPTQATQRRGRR